MVLNLLVPNELDDFFTGVATPAAGGCNQIGNSAACESGETLIWNLGTISARQSVTASLTPIVSAGAVGPIVFNPTLTSGPSGSATVTVNAARTLDVSVHEAWDPVAAGNHLVYTLHFGNTSTTNTAPNALLRLPVPAGTAFVSASDSCVLNAGTVEWPLGTLQPGQSGTRTVTVLTNAGLVRGVALARAGRAIRHGGAARARARSDRDRRSRSARDRDGARARSGRGRRAAGDRAHCHEHECVGARGGDTPAALAATDRSALHGTGDLRTRGLHPDRQQRGLLGGRVHGLEPRHAGRGTERHGLVLGGHRCGDAGRLGRRLRGDRLQHRRRRARGGGPPRRGGLVAPARAEPARGVDPVAVGDEIVYTLHFGNTSTVDTAPNACSASRCRRARRS